MRTAALLRTLRKLHAWVGLSGAAFGLVFGVTGFLLNHRATLKIPPGEIQEHTATVELPEAPASPGALAQVMAAHFNLPAARVKVTVRSARSGRMGGAAVTTSEQWMVVFSGHAHFARAAYVPGNHSIEVEQKDAGPLETLKRLHKADAGQTGWILFTDAFAGSLVFLTLSGILLWTRFNGPKLLAAGLSLGTLAVAALVVLRCW